MAYNDPRHLLALTGPTGSGKDTLANRYRAERGYYHTKFADPLRSAYYQTHGNDLSKAGDRGYESAFINQMILYSRTILEYHRYAWVTLWEMTLPGDVDLVVSDLRQPHELKRIQEHGGEVYRVYRPNNPHPPRALDNLLLNEEWEFSWIQASMPTLPAPNPPPFPEVSVLRPPLPRAIPDVLSQGSTSVSIQNVIDGIRYLQDKRNTLPL